MGCSSQNVKKLALQLEKLDLIKISNDPTDLRSLLIHKIEKYYLMLSENNDIGSKTHDCLFNEFTDEEIEIYYTLSKKLYVD